MMYDTAAKGTHYLSRVRNRLRHDAQPGHISSLHGRFTQAAAAPAGSRTKVFLKSQSKASTDTGKGIFSRLKAHLHGSGAAQSPKSDAESTYSSPGHTYDAVSDNQSAAKSIV